MTRKNTSRRNQSAGWRGNNKATPRRRRSPSKSRVKISTDTIRHRSLFVVFLVFLAFTGMAGRMVFLGFTPITEPEVKISTKPTEAPVRGDIVDRNGVLLATSLQVHSLYADPKEILDANEIVLKLTKVLPYLNKDRLTKHLNRKGRFVWLARQLTPAQVKQVNDLGLPGLAFRKELARVYPQQGVAAHLVGAVNKDSKGLAGVERSYNHELSRGETVELTIDTRLQAALMKSLKETVDSSKALGAAGVILDPKTGDIMAMASLPEFDPNDYGNANKESWRNRITHGAYEMGSTFKVFTLANALEHKVITPETEVDCKKPLKVGKYFIRDSHPKARVLTAHEVLQYSSNIGTAQIAELTGEDEMRAFYQKLHLFDDMNVGLRGVASPQFKLGNWGRIRTMTSSYGHGIAVTPLHVAAAFNAVVTDGYYKFPHIVKGELRNDPEYVLSKNTVDQLKPMLRDVVQEGTARRARVAGFDIGGKTGTSEKAEAGGYAKNKNIAAFVGAVPLEDPRFVGLIMVDEGKLPNGRAAGGGHVAAPTFAAFVKRAAPIVGMVPQNVEQPRAAELLLPYEQSYEVAANAFFRTISTTNRY